MVPKIIYNSKTANLNIILMSQVSEKCTGVLR